MCLGTLGIAPQLHFLLPILKGIEILPASLVMKTGLFIEILAMDNDPFQSAFFLMHAVCVINMLSQCMRSVCVCVHVRNVNIIPHTPAHNLASHQTCKQVQGMLNTPPPPPHPSIACHTPDDKKHLKQRDRY